MTKCICQISPSVSWVVEQSSILLVDTQKDRSFLLKYPEAALWDLVLGRYGKKELVSILSAVISDGKKEAMVGDWIETTLDKWAVQGWLTACKKHG